MAGGGACARGEVVAGGDEVGEGLGAEPEKQEEEDGKSDSEATKHLCLLL